MMKKNFISKAILALSIVAFAFTSCSSDDSNSGTRDDNNNGGDNQQTEETVFKYIVGANASESSLLLTVDNIETGSISVRGNGLIVMDPEIHTYNNERGFVFEYRKGDPSAMQSIDLKENGLQIATEVILPGRKEFISVFGDKILATAGFQKPDNKRVQEFYLIDPKTGGIGQHIELDVAEIVEPGEYANFSGLVPIDDSRFIMAVEPFKLNGDPSAHRDTVWIVVFKYDGNTITVDKVVKDDRMSFAVGRRRSGRLSCIGQASDGSIYAFSPSNMIGSGDNRVNFSSLPSSVLKFNKETLEFDKNYYFDIESKSGGHKIQQADALTGDYFLLNMFAKVGVAWNFAQANKMALFNAKTGDFKWIEGFPQAENIAAYTVKYYVDGDDVYIPLTGDGKSFIYKINLETAQATPGLEIKDVGDGEVYSVNKLKVVK